MTQFMKLLLAASTTGMVMTTAASPPPVSWIPLRCVRQGRSPPSWGFSPLVEIAGKRILFDTGDDRDIFAANCKYKIR